ncbi:MAG: pilus assembly protein TadG-related protein, partial [Flavobacteriaceae bacterium]
MRRVSLKRLCRRFAADGRGNVAVIFGIALVPLIAMAGAALDYSSAYNLRAKMQAAADAAALAATRNYGKSWATRKQIATDTFNHDLQSLTSASGVTFNIVDQGQSHLVTASAVKSTSLLGVVGIHYIPVSVEAKAMTPVASLEVVLVLDNTGSMSSSNKIGVLKQAANNFINMMETAAAIPGKTIKLGLVPFTTNVRLNASTYKNASWLDMTTSERNNWKGCLYDREYPYDVDDTTPTASNAKTLFDPDPDTAYSSSKCDMAKVHELSSSFSSLRSRVSDMKADGNTNITLGVVWGLHLLSSTTPFTEGDPWSKVETTKVMIVLTDGENTESRQYGSTSSIDNRTKKACDAVKAK